MDFYIGLAQVIGVHTLLGLSAWCVLHTGQVSLAQGGFFAVGAYTAGMLTAMAGWTRTDMLIRYTRATAVERARTEAARLNLGDL